MESSVEISCTNCPRLFADIFTSLACCDLKNIIGRYVPKAGVGYHYLLKQQHARLMPLATLTLCGKGYKNQRAHPNIVFCIAALSRKRQRRGGIFLNLAPFVRALCAAAEVAHGVIVGIQPQRTAALGVGCIQPISTEDAA